MSNLFSSSNVCAHALGLETTPSKPVSHSMQTVHEHAEHFAHSAHNQQHNEHDECPKDCDGGSDCVGCSALPFSITVKAGQLNPPNTAANFTATHVSVLAKTFALEPPPPRTT